MVKLPSLPDEPMNENRANWAESALNVFRMITLQNPDNEPIKESFSDLLCDLRHLADRYGFDWDAAIRGAEENYAAEIVEDGPPCRRLTTRWGLMRSGKYLASGNEWSDSVEDAIELSDDEKCSFITEHSDLSLSVTDGI